MHRYLSGAIPNDLHEHHTSTAGSSSVNQSWICPLDLRDLDRWPVAQNDSRDCLFLFQQQINRAPNSYAPVIECATATLLWIASIPLNFFAVVNFHNRNVNPEFLFLMACHAICNIAMTTIGALKGLVRLYDDYPFGDFGCMMIFCGMALLMTSIVWIDCLVSFERLASVRSLVPNVGKGHRLKLVIFSVIAALTINVACYLYLFVYYDVALTLDVHVEDRAKMILTSVVAVKLVKVCVIATENVPQSTLQNVIFTIMTFVVPVTITTINYIIIWRTVRKSMRFRARLFVQAKRFNTGRGNQTIQQIIGSNRVLAASRQQKLDQQVGNANNHRQIEAGLAVLTVTSLVFFIVCILPSHVVYAYIMYYDASNGMTVHSSLFFYCNCLICLEACINPFLQSLLRPAFAFVPVAAYFSNNNNNNNNPKNTKKPAEHEPPATSAALVKPILATGTGLRAGRRRASHVIIRTDIENVRLNVFDNNRRNRTPSINSQISL